MNGDLADGTRNPPRFASSKPRTRLTTGCALHDGGEDGGNEGSAGNGEFLGDEITDDPEIARTCAVAFERVWECAVPHASYKPV